MDDIYLRQLEDNGNVVIKDQSIDQVLSWFNNKLPRLTESHLNPGTTVVAVQDQVEFPDKGSPVREVNVRIDIVKLSKRRSRLETFLITNIKRLWVLIKHSRSIHYVSWSNADAQWYFDTTGEGSFWNFLNEGCLIGKEELSTRLTFYLYSPEIFASISKPSNEEVYRGILFG